jgi:hypothetical protein
MRFSLPSTRQPKCGGTKSSAALESLFKVDESCEKLDQDKDVEFHNLVEKTVYATKRARPDTCTEIACLTTRVRAPDKDDWTKLVHLIRYIRGTHIMPLILSANGSGIMKWWLDASFAAHPNMCGHSVGGLSLGRGFPVVSSTKQKLNTRSSTETDIVGAEDFMPEICWTRYFMKAQGYGVKDNVLFQDNKSSILLEKNGKALSSKSTKHINIRYFFITNRVNKEEVLVVWCPTGDMIGGYATKPLQEALFRKFRDQIMGVTPARDPGPGKTNSGVGKTETSKNKPNKVKVISLVPPRKETETQECVGCRTQDRAKRGPRRVKKVADSEIFDQSTGKSVSYAQVVRVGQEKHNKIRSLFHLTSKV